MGNIIFNKIITIIIIIFLIALSFLLLKNCFFIILPFYLGYLVSKLFIPIIKKSKLKHTHLLSVLIFILIIFFISTISIIIFFIFKSIIMYISTNFINNGAFKNSIYYYINILKESNFPFNLKMDIKVVIENSLQTFLNSLIDKLQIIIEKSFKLITLLPEILVFIIVTSISAFFFTKDYLFINEYYFNHIKKYHDILKSNHYYIMIKNNVSYVLLGYLKAQLILMSLTFALSSIGLGIIGIDNFILKSFAISLIDALPFFGTAIIMIPWIIFKLILRNYFHAAALLIIYLILTTTRQSIEPKIFSNQIGLYPLITLFSIYSGLKTLGFIGVFIGPIVVILLKTAIDAQAKHEH